MKKRFLYNEVIKYLEHKNALIITGMRQVGKTTLLKQIYDEVKHPKIWFDFDNPLDLLLFENSNYEGIYSNLHKELNSKKHDRLFVFIDEIQNFPEITKIIKYLIDKHSVKFLVTGSSNYYLKNLFPESLSGRKFLFILRPMEFKEYLYFNTNLPDLKINAYGKISSVKPSAVYEYKKHENEYDNYLEYGGLPEVVLSDDFETKRLVLKNIFTSFFKKDLRLLSDLSDIRELRDLIILLSARTGNILDVSKLSSELGINRVKTYSYLEFLQGIFFIKLISKYSKSIDRSIAGGRKVYFSDNGLLNIFAKISSGQMFENAIANQLLKYGELKYYNVRNTSEIDFILNNETAFEVKHKGSERDVFALKKICDKIGLKKHFVVSKEYV
ncbi:MAG: ATP-binding protein, partial [Ignavibacteriae bacterium]|nr:ATP-binding protein [Ignavibacteriota bacterium]